MRWRAALSTFVVLALGGCATATVGSHIESGLDVAPFRTYAWGPADALPEGDARLERNPVFRDTVEGAVDKQFALNHLVVASPDRADLLIHYHAAITRRLDVNRIDRQYGYCYGDDCRVRVVEYEAGTLVLDIVDARTNKVIWRGWARDVVAPILADEDHMRRTTVEAVTRMLERFFAAPAADR